MPPTIPLMMPNSNPKGATTIESAAPRTLKPGVKISIAAYKAAAVAIAALNGDVNAANTVDPKACSPVPIAAKLVPALPIAPAKPASPKAAVALLM